MNIKYNKVVGIGGIGYGMLFHSDTNETLGRNESRLVSLSLAKDYCKLQIILYYVATILDGKSKVFPVGYVGNDALGIDLVSQMKEQGMDVSFVQYSDALPTMLSVCIQYSDKDGGNITASNSACGLVTKEYIENRISALEIDDKTIVLAAPEVEVLSRIQLLKEGKAKNAFCVASVAQSEAEEFLLNNAFEYCDLLAVNETEAATLANFDGDEYETTQKLYDKLKMYNSEIMVMVTCGKKGCYTAYHNNIEFVPPLLAEVKNTTGAGDACLGGTISAIALGMAFQKGCNDKKFGDTTIKSAVELGTLCAGMAVESVDSIAFNVTNDTILKRIKDGKWRTVYEL